MQTRLQAPFSSTSGHRLPGSGFLALLLGLALWCASALIPADGREVRVATYNILDGTSDIGSEKYNAIAAVLARVDADIVCFQELRPGTFGAWSNLATELGYPHASIGGNGPFSGGLYNGYFSRFPILSTHNVTSPPGAIELTRYPFRVVVEVPDAQRPLVLWNMHHKSSDANIDKFRRAIEAYRIVQDIDAYLAANPEHVEYVFAGDMNDDIRDSQTPAQFASQPSGAPESYVLGSDITFPVPYAVFPTDRYAGAGEGLIRTPAYWESGGSPVTRPSSGRQLDYVFLSPALVNSPLGAPIGEVYYSFADAGGGLPKWGDPLPAGTSDTASDHLPVFVDVQMADNSVLLPTSGFAAAGEAGGPFDPESKVYTLTETNSYDTFWSVSADVGWVSVSENSFWLSPLVPQDVVVFLNANAQALPPGVHVGTVTFWNETSDFEEKRSVTLTIRDHLDVMPATGLVSSGLLGGPFSPDAQTYVVTNKSTLTISFTAAAASSWVAVSPGSGTLEAGQAAEVTVSLNANALGLPIGNHADTVVFSNETTGLIHERPVTLAVAGALCEAVDLCSLAWTTGGNAGWFYQSEITFDGTDAAQSGPIAASQQSWMETVVEGPLRVSFDWRVSSRTNSHYLRFLDNGTSRGQVSGETGWQRRAYDLGAGLHTLRWSYTNTTTAPVGSNAGWVDRVTLDYLAVTPADTWTPAGVPGGPFSPATRLYGLTNAGAEALSWAVTPNVVWISADVAEGELPPFGSAAVELSLNENAETLGVGVYSGSVTFSNRTSGEVYLRQAQLTVRDYLIITPDYSYHTGYVGGPYSPPAQTYALSNSGPMAVQWSAGVNTNWVTVEPAGGLIEPGGRSNIVASLNAGADALHAGWSYAQMIFSNETTQLAQTRWVYVSLQDAMAVTAPSWVPTGPFGGPFAPTSTVYVLTNRSGRAFDWTASVSSNWLSLNPAAGTLASNASAAVTAFLNSNADALPRGVYSASVVFSNTATGAALSRPVTLLAGIVFCDAMEACAWEWTFGGNAPWLYQIGITKDGLDAAASGLITDDQESWMETTVTNVGDIFFWWKVSSEANWDYLEFWINGVRTNRMSGQVDWQQQTYTLGPGTHRLRWRYVKDGSVDSGEDRGWVDLLEWTPAFTAMGVPTAWYKRFGLAPGPGETWDDLDHRPSASGAPNWAQYAAGLDPTDPDDVFEMLGLRGGGGEPMALEWRGGTNGATSAYIIQGAFDPRQTNAWETVGMQDRAAGVNVWTNPEPAAPLHLFRILALPAP